MGQIVDLYGFIAVVLHGLTLALEAITVGGVIFLCLVHSTAPTEEAAAVRCRKFLRLCAFVLATTAIGSIVLTTLVLRATTDGFRWIDTVHTYFFYAEFFIVAAGIAIAIFAPTASAPWLLLPATLIVTGAVLSSHAFARIESRALLLMCTGLHHFATAAWIGGLPWLLIVLRRGTQPFSLRIARHFSRVALVSVPILVGAGIVMGREYVGSVPAMYGTAYGVMLAAKLVLLGLILGLGAANYKLLKENTHTQNAIGIVRRIVEVEAAMGVVVILVASSMTSQPPAVDLTEGRLSLGEIVGRFTPHWPHLQTPSVEALSPPSPLNAEEAKRFKRRLAYTPGADPTPNTPGDIAWSEYNHNWAGVCMLGVGLLALISQMPFGRWARHWPLAFLALAVFILIRADPENWPLGTRGFWESFQVPDVLQHRFAVLLVAALAIFEWRVATNRSRQSWHALVLPAICMLGGALLFTHMHMLGNFKEELLAEQSHTAIAIFAIVAAGARWLQLRLRRGPALLGFVWTACFVMIGMMLTIYREGEVIQPRDGFPVKINSEAQRAATGPNSPYLHLSSTKPR